MVKLKVVKKEINIERDTAKYTFTLETGRKHKYDGFDVFPDDELKRLLSEAMEFTTWELKEKRGVRRLQGKS